MVRFWRYIRQIRRLTRDLSCYISHRIFVKLFNSPFSFSNLPLSKGSSFTSHRLFHLCPEMHTMAKMAKNRQRTGDSHWTPKVAPSNLITKEGPSNREANVCHFRHCVHFWTYLECSQNRWRIFAIILAVFATFPKLSFPHNVDKILSSLPFSLLVHFWT